MIALQVVDYRIQTSWYLRNRSSFFALQLIDIFINWSVWLNLVDNSI